jgi:hypothetical protein
MPDRSTRSTARRETWSMSTSRRSSSSRKCSPGFGDFDLALLGLASHEAVRISWI